MYEQHLIDHKIFSMLLVDGKSQIIFGGVDNALKATPDEHFRYCHISSYNFWSVFISGISLVSPQGTTYHYPIKGAGDSSKPHLSVEHAIIDSGTSFIILPEVDLA